MQVSEFDFSLPERAIAKYPLANRSASQLLAVDLHTNNIVDDTFANLPQYLNSKDLLVLNNTKVIPARLLGHKQTGGQVECLVEHIVTERDGWCHIKSNRRPKIGDELIFSTELSACVRAEKNGLLQLTFSQPILKSLYLFGEVPIPPYLKRAAEKLDQSRYQTVYALQPGAIAAPTAGLHFDQPLFDALNKQGIEHTFITLHVGAGTFKPVKTENISDHIMHAEHYEITQQSIDKIKHHQAIGGRIIAVGTTVVRALESMYQQYGRWQACQDSSNLFITPGFHFNCIDGLITNFHLPRSTLLMMISALMGHNLMHKAYQHAINHNYRFYSYGDAMLIHHPRP